MKLSVSLPEEDVAVLDRYVREVGLPSRSAGLQQALRRLRRPSLQQDYADAYAEWDDSAEPAAWDAVTSDGLDGRAGDGRSAASPGEERDAPR